jgi:YidC/Oxa1 family membrane protein insertase
MYDRKTWIIVAACSILLALNIYYAPKKNPAEEEKQRAEAAAQSQPKPEAGAQAASPGVLTVPPPAPPADEQLVTLETDKTKFTLTTLGGGVKFAEMKTQFEVGSDKELVRLNRSGKAAVGALGDADDVPVQLSYAYDDKTSVAGKSAVYTATLPSGLVARKTYQLVKSEDTGSSYLIECKLDLENPTAQPISLDRVHFFLGTGAPLYAKEWAQQTGFFWRGDGSMNFSDSSKFTGGMISTAQTIINGTSPKLEFAGVCDQFFATVLQVDGKPLDAKIWGRTTDISLPGADKPLKAVYSGLRLPSTDLKPGDKSAFSFRLYMGPKDNNLLRKMDNRWGDGWGDVMQYGWFGLVSRFLNWVLHWLQAGFGKFANKWSWGLAIIALTIIVRTAIWPLYATSTRSMKRMSKLQPEIRKLKEKYPDDPTRMNQETMKLYKKFGVNPVGGCLPMFIQIPIFFGFYRMLQYAVELRGHGFLWVHDLSQPDTLFTLHNVPFFGNLGINLLPILMAITSFVQMAMTPKTGDKSQQRIMMFMPFMFFFFCYTFASALALYWTTQNIFSIAQTWVMGKIPEPELKERKIASGGKSGGLMERLAAKREELERAKKAGAMRNITPDEKKKRTPRTGG